MCVLFVKMKWNRNDTAVLTEVYCQRYPLLRNIMDKDYTNKTLKDNLNLMNITYWGNGFGINQG